MESDNAMNVPRLRFSGFNDNYILNTYDNVINIIDGDRGINYPKESDFYDDEYCLFLNAGNVTKNGFNFSNKSFITLKKDNELRNGKLRRNDVVLTTRGTVGNVALYDDSISFENIRINSGMVINRVKSNKLLPQYLYQFMQSSIFDFQVKKANFGSAQPQLTKKGIAKFNIAYPSIKEQRKVCSFLSLLDKKIELQTKRIETLKYFKKGLINYLFSQNTSMQITVKDLGTIITGTTPSKENKLFWDNGNIPWITPSDITYERDISNSMVKLTEDGLLNGRYLPKDSILVTCIASIGKNAVLKEDGSCNQQINAIIPNKKFNHNYIYYLMEYMSNYMKSIAGTSATSIINKNDFENINVNVHSITEQIKIDKILSSIEIKEKLEDEYLHNITKLKSYLLQNMFI